MDAAFFARSVTLRAIRHRAVREAFARGLGCPPEAFATERLTIVERPDPPAWSFTALLATFGTGTVLSIDPTLSTFTHAHAPTRHVRAMEPEFLQLLIAEGARRRTVLQTAAPGPGFTLSAPPGRVKPPPGYGLTLVDAAWMAEEMSSHHFENGVGERGVGGREYRNQFAAVLLDPTDVPVAVAGVFLTYGLFEIGVDVIRDQRGKGLAPRSSRPPRRKLSPEVRRRSIVAPPRTSARSGRRWRLGFSPCAPIPPSSLNRIRETTRTVGGGQSR